MKRRDLIFVIIIIAVVSGLVYLERSGKHPKPTVQSIPEHQNFDRNTPRTTCLACHNPENGTAAKRITVTHPEKWKDEKFSCLGCHKLQPAGTPANAGLGKGAPAR
jgi:hypothetical protein